MDAQEPKYTVCWKCRWLVANPGGFFRRDKSSGPCDRCLGKMTIFQQLMEKDIWIKFIPPREEKKQRPIEPKREQPNKGATDTNKVPPKEK